MTTKRTIAGLLAAAVHFAMPGPAEADAPIKVVGQLHLAVDGVVIVGRILPRAELDRWALSPAFGRVSSPEAISDRTIYGDRLYIAYVLGPDVRLPNASLFGRDVELEIVRDARRRPRVVSIRPK